MNSLKLWIKIERRVKMIGYIKKLMGIYKYKHDCPRCGERKYDFHALCDGVVLTKWWKCDSCKYWKEVD